MPTLAISSEARGRLRLLWTQLESHATKIERATDRIPIARLRDFERKGRVGRDRALARILTGMPIRPFHTERDTLSFKYLRPLDSIPPALGMSADPADAQPCLAVYIVMLNAGRGRQRVRRELFGAAFTLHSLGRFTDRSNFSADPIDAVWQAHTALLLLPPDEGQRIFDLEQRLPLPAGPGCFMASIRHVGNTSAPVALSSTWLHNDQLHDDQSADATTWRKLFDEAERG